MTDFSYSSLHSEVIFTFLFLQCSHLRRFHTKEYEYKQLKSINMHVSIYNKQKYLSISQYLRLSKYLHWWLLGGFQLPLSSFQLPLPSLFVLPPSFATVLFNADWSNCMISWIPGRYSPVAVVPSFLGIHGLINVRICRTHNVF